jgi:hypothetical protein
MLVSALILIYYFTVTLMTCSGIRNRGIIRTTLMRCSAGSRDVMSVIRSVDDRSNDWHITANENVDYSDNDGIWVAELWKL